VQLCFKKGRPCNKFRVSQTKNTCINGIPGKKGDCVTLEIQHLIMKYIVLLITVGLAFSIQPAEAQVKKPAATTIGRKRTQGKPPQFKVEALLGKWQETARKNANAKMDEYVHDTLYLDFAGGTTVHTQEGNSAIITGTAEIGNDDILSTSANDYKIISLDEKQLVLDDLNGHLRYLDKKTAFYGTGVPINNTPVGDLSSKVVELNDANLIRNWFAYRRAAAPGAIKPGSPVIRNLKILKKEGNNYSGVVDFAQNGALVSEPATLVFTGNQLTLNSATQKWNMTVYTADGKELMMGTKGELVYYFKIQ